MFNLSSELEGVLSHVANALEHEENKEPFSALSGYHRAKAQIEYIIELLEDSGNPFVRELCKSFLTTYDQRIQVRAQNRLQSHLQVGLVSLPAGSASQGCSTGNMQVTCSSLFIKGCFPDMEQHCDLHCHCLFHRRLRLSTPTQLPTSSRAVCYAWPAPTTTAQCLQETLKMSLQMGAQLVQVQRNIAWRSRGMRNGWTSFNNASVMCQAAWMM